MKRFLFIAFMGAFCSNISAVSNFERAQNCYNKGCVLLDANNNAEALKQFGAAIDLDPTNPNFWERRGSAYFNLHNYAAAISDYTRAINLAPQVGFYYTERALAYGYIGNANAMMTDLTIATSLGEPEAQKIVAAQIAKANAENAAYRQNLRTEINEHIRQRFEFKTFP